MYQCSKKLVKYKEYSCFDHSDFPAHSMFTFDVCWGSLGTSIFGNSSSAANNTQSRLPSRLSFRFLWLCVNKFSYILIISVLNFLIFMHFTNQITLKLKILSQKLNLIFKFSSIKRKIYIPLWVHMGIKNKEKMGKFLEGVIPLL